MTYDEAVAEMRKFAATQGSDAVAKTDELIRRAKMINDATAHISTNARMSGMAAELAIHLVAKKTEGINTGNVELIKEADNICRDTIGMLIRVLRLEQAYENYIDRSIPDDGKRH